MSHPFSLNLTLNPHPHTTLFKATIFRLAAPAQPALECRLCLHRHPQSVLSPCTRTPNIAIHSIISIVLPYQHRPSLPPPKKGLGKSAPQFPSHSVSKPSDLHNHSVLCGFPPLRSQGFLQFTWTGNINYGPKRQRADGEVGNLSENP